MGTWVGRQVKQMGFLSYGHYQDVPGSLTPTAGDGLLQAIDLAVAAEEVGADGAFVRVHHFAPQQASPPPTRRRGCAHQADRPGRRRDRLEVARVWVVTLAPDLDRRDGRLNRRDAGYEALNPV